MDDPRNQTTMELLHQVEKPDRNPGMALELDWINRVQVNRSAVERRAATIPTRRSIKKQWQAAWLLRAISCIDLTTLSGDDTPGKVHRLCQKAKYPVRKDILAGLGVPDLQLTVGAVCVYHNMIPAAAEALKGTNIPIAAVSTGFPDAQISLDQKLAQIEQSVKAGATEIDIVVSREKVINSDWEGLYTEIASYREACGDAHMKAILSTGQHPTFRHVGKASLVAMMAGADFIKTSTGKESVNATLPVSLVMVRAIREYYQETGYLVGFKPAGGIRAAKQTLAWLALMKEELGTRWTRPDLFRFGASSLLGDIERQLEHNSTGRYSAGNRHAMS